MTDYEKYVGKRAYTKLGLSVLVEVKILDYKNKYGHDRFLVTPIAGKGEMWTETIELIAKKK